MPNAIKELLKEKTANCFQKLPKARPPIKVVDALADDLVHTYNNQGYRRWYCDVVNTIGVDKVEEFRSRAKEGGKPARLFSSLASQEMKRYE